MKTIVTKKYYVIYTSTKLFIFSTGSTEIDSIHVVEQFDTPQQAINRLLGLGFDTFQVPIQLTGTQFEYREPVYSDNILTAYENGEAVYSDNVLTGYSEITNDTKILELKKKEYNWITEKELDNQRIYGLNEDSLVFCAILSNKNIKKNVNYYTFASLLTSQMTPSKRRGEYLYAYLSFLDKTNDLFNIDAKGNVINPYSPDIEILQLTTNLKIVIDEDGNEIIIKDD